MSDIIPIEIITGMIHNICGQRVMLDRPAPLNCSKNKPEGHSTGGFSGTLRCGNQSAEAG